MGAPRAPARYWERCRQPQAPVRDIQCNIGAPRRRAELLPLEVVQLTAAEVATSTPAGARPR